MKAKILFFAYIALCLPAIFGMAKNNKKTQAVGVLEYYGNAPFARLGLKAQDGTLYYLDATKDEQEKLGKLHGNAVIVEGTLLDDPAPLEMPNASVLRVKNWKKK
ncbi:MAG: hypothetical protein VZQ47_03240 [Treponema sp.]|nr:hypothetical protein [Treponema sp.]MEE3434558.1 hypothetical protein [Treponema sp.]